MLPKSGLPVVKMLQVLSRAFRDVFHAEPYDESFLKCGVEVHGK